MQLCGNIEEKLGMFVIQVTLSVNKLGFCCGMGTMNVVMEIDTSSISVLMKGSTTVWKYVLCYSTNNIF